MLTGDVPPALLDAVRQAGLDSVDGAFAYGGGADLVKPGLGHRRRTRIELPDANGQTHVLYLKRYAPTSAGEALRRWRTSGRRASPARIEFDNIRLVRAAGAATMREVVCGEDFCLLGARRSYLIVTAVPGDAMERCFENYLASHDEAATAGLTSRLARMVRSLHAAGCVHRDLYAAHVFLDSSGGADDLYLIDLARVFRPRLRRRRWFVKDLAQLKYSMPAAWIAGHWAGFLAEYLAETPGGMQMRKWNALIDRKVESISRHDERRRQRAGARAGGPTG